MHRQTQQTASAITDLFSIPPSVLLSYIGAAVAAFSAIAYELLLASYATFLLGASIFQYSMVISLMMASMGIGALLSSKFLNKAIISFLSIELILAWIAALALPLLYFLFYSSFSAQGTIYFLVVLMGTAIGMEIPLLVELNRSQGGLSKVLFFDYLGGFLGGLIFPLWLLPKLGYFRVAATLSLVNAILALGILAVFHQSIHRFKTLWILLAGITLIFSVLSFGISDSVRLWMESRYFNIQHQ